MLNSEKNVKKQICFNDCNNDVDITIALAKYFSSVYYNSDSDFNEVDAFLNSHAECNSGVNINSNVTTSSIHVSIIDGCIRNLKLGKTCGPDELAAKHLVHART